ncbi:hypothetical protein [Curtobacterium citreum]|uniref:hypothetical protein n=1 Tax=Curtobacterium citreum TaxID=2036 RepID=UPI002542CFA7|nr:hypothetical protein [Curtobacterium citreum]WIJ46546.1 hypothetical protein QPK07_06180 [Curtobacterium citreum]
MLWLVEFRKHLPVFIAVAVATSAVSIAATAFPKVVALEVVQALCVLLCWSATTCYSAAVVFSFLALGRDQLLQLSTRSRWQLAFLKLCVLTVLLVAQHALTVGLQIRDLTDAAGKTAPAAIVYVLLAKIVSISVFLLGALLLATLSKLLRSRGTATTFFAVGLVGVIVVQALLLWRSGAPDTHDFFIGVGGHPFTVNLYANILPLTLTGPSSGFLPSIAGWSMVLNLTAALLFTAAWAVIARGRKFDFLTM